MGPLSTLTHATLLCTSRQRNREWQQQLKGLSCLNSAPLLAKVVSALSGCRKMEVQVLGLQPQDRQLDSSGQEHRECTMFLSVYLKREKPQWSCNLLPTNSDFFPCPLSEGHTCLQTRTPTRTQM